jgi:hypothetical protein
VKVVHSEVNEFLSGLFTFIVDFGGIHYTLSTYFGVEGLWVSLNRHMEGHTFLMLVNGINVYTCTVKPLTFPK